MKLGNWDSYSGWWRGSFSTPRLSEVVVGSNEASILAPGSQAGALSILAWLVGLAICIAIVVWPNVSVIDPGANAPRRITIAEFLPSDVTEPPADVAAWQSRLLPDSWLPSGATTAQTSGWYRLRFDLTSIPEQPYAIYIPAVSPVAALYANRSHIGRTGMVDRPPNVGHPQYFVIPPNELRVGANELLVNVAGRGMRGLTPITVGEDSVVRPEYERRYFWQVSGLQFCAVFAALWGIFAMLMWLRRRDDAIYLYFGLSGLFWAAFTTIAEVVRFPPLPQWLWMALLPVTAMGKITFMALFALRYAGLRLPKLEAALLVYCALLIGIQWGAPALGIEAWLADNRRWFLLSIVFFYVGVFIFAAWRQPSVESVLVAIAGSVHFLNWAYQKAVPHPFGTLEVYAYDVLPMILVLGWILIDRFIKALKEAENLNTELERRVAQKHAELGQNFERMRQMERQAAVVEERERIMRDMHDGIGGQLISTLSLVERGHAASNEIATALRECLDDLRLTIDSLEPTGNDLLAILGNFRYRIDARLKTLGIDVDWQVRDVPKLACLAPQNVLHILRILQEAFTNIVKHANANTIRVETCVDPDGRHVHIRVCDDGGGFQEPKPGRGLENMRRRAQHLGGTLGIRPTAQGTALDLMLPVA